MKSELNTITLKFTGKKLSSSTDIDIDSMLAPDCIWVEGNYSIEWSIVDGNFVHTPIDFSGMSSAEAFFVRSSL